MSDVIRVAVVGASGSMGAARVKQFSADKRARVVAACARDIRKLNEAVPDASIKLVSHAEEIYADPAIDAVVISVPNTLHYEHIKQALEAGKHVHCEYPLTQTLEQFDELAKLAKAHNLVLHHAMTTRAESLHLTMKGALEGLGEPRAAYYRYYGGSGWYVDPTLRGDMFCALHIHFIDQFTDLFGDPEKLVAHGAETAGQVCAVVMMQWPNGLTGTIEFAMGFRDKPSYMGTIVTSDGWVGFDNGGDGLTVTVGKDGECGEMTPPPDTSKDEDAASFLDQILGTGAAQYDLLESRKILGYCLECSRQLA